MKDWLIINTFDGKYAVVTDKDPENRSIKLGELYYFEPLVGVLMKDSYDEQEVHYGSISKPIIPKGTKVTVNKYWANFYGAYFKISYEGVEYDVKTNKVKIIKGE